MELNLVLWDVILSSLLFSQCTYIFPYLFETCLANPSKSQTSARENNYQRMGDGKADCSFSTDPFGLLLPQFSKTPLRNTSFIHLLYCALWTVCRRNWLCNVPTLCNIPSLDTWLGSLSTPEGKLNLTNVQQPVWYVWLFWFTFWICIYPSIHMYATHNYKCKNT